MLSALDLARRIEGGEIEAAAVIELCGEVIAAREAEIGAFVVYDLERARRAEKLESFKAILIGVGSPDANNPNDPDNATKQYLEEFKDRAGFDQFVWVGASTPQNIAKMAAFVSRSVSSSSQSLGTGGQSQNLSF